MFALNQFNKGAYIHSAPCQNIFQCIYTGDLLKKISSGAFSDGCKHAGLVYVASMYEPTIHVYDPSTWSRIRTLFSACSCVKSYNHTLRVTSCSITLACPGNDRIYVLDISGEQQQTHGKKGMAVGEFSFPRLCSAESDGSMLVADHNNNRLQVFHDGEWCVQQLQPQPFEPMDAVVTPHAIYVVTWDKKLIMYKID